MPKSFNVKTRFTAEDGVTKKLKRMGGAAAGVARQSGTVAAAAGAAIVSIFNVNKEFQQSMNRIEARLGNATEAQLKQLKNTAKELGRTTTFSASQAADGMAFLAQSGWEVSEILAGIPHLLNMAAAAETDLATTSDIVSNIMSQFGMSADETKKAVDLLATSTSNANIDLVMLKDSMKGAGPIAASFGADLKDAATIAGFLGNMGIQGTNAMTAMKGMFGVFTNPTPKAKKWFDEMNLSLTEMDGKGNRVMRDIDSIFKDMGKSMAGMDQPKRLKAIGDIFGKIVAPGAGAMSADIAKADSVFGKLTERMDKFDNRAKEMADIMMDGAPGAVSMMMSAIEGLSIAMGESGLLLAVTGGITLFTDFLAVVTEYAPFLTVLLGVVFALAGAITMVAGGIVLAAKAWTLWKSAFAIAKIAMSAFNVAAVMSPLGLLIIGVTLLITGFITLVNKAGSVTGALSIITDTIMGMVRAIGSFFGIVDDNKDKKVKVTTEHDDKTSPPKTGPGGGVVGNVVTGGGLPATAGAAQPATATATAANGRVQVDVNDNTSNQNVTAKANGQGLKLKLNPATS